MRIISGKYKGKTIKAPKNLPVRPTTDFAKESLFNILNNQFDFENLDVLDLCSGTGNIAYEFISRRVKSIKCVDKNYHCIKFINKIMKELDVNNYILSKSDIFSYLKKCHLTFDVIFADPPYALKNIQEIPNIVFEKKLLNNNGWLIVEHDRNTTFENHPNFFNHRKYGNVNFSIFY